MAKKEKPTDPLLSATPAFEGGPLPGFSSQPVDNYDTAAENLHTGVASIQTLDMQIAVLNGQKSQIYTRLALMGFEKKIVRAAVSQLRIDPLVRAELAMKLDTYMRAVERAAAQLAATPQAEGDDAVAA
jgi:uncharacterized protein (UPF0335 family)